MKLQTQLVCITPYFMFMQQASDAMEQIRASASGVKVSPLQFAGFQGQVNTLQEHTTLEVTSFDGVQSSSRVISPTLRSPE